MHIIRTEAAVEYVNGDGKYHREDGPAIEYTNGTKAWYLHGERHRIGGPAIEWHNGDQSWYQNDEYHREDGPSIIWESRKPEWWYRGKSIPVDNLQDFQVYIRNKAFW